MKALAELDLRVEKEINFGNGHTASFLYSRSTIITTQPKLLN